MATLIQAGLVAQPREHGLDGAVRKPAAPGRDEEAEGSRRRAKPVALKGVRGESRDDGRVNRHMSGPAVLAKSDEETAPRDVDICPTEPRSHQNEARCRR